MECLETYPNFDASEHLVLPILNIRAIGVQLNYINFDPTPTALLRHTFEVTTEECASTALQTSIHAQWADLGKTLGLDLMINDAITERMVMMET